MKVEIQLRTQLQHSWAMAVETAGLVTNTAMKSGQGSELFGILDYKERNPQSTFTFDYNGFDIDDIWQCRYTGFYPFRDKRAPDEFQE